MSSTQPPSNRTLLEQIKYAFEMSFQRQPNESDTHWRERVLAMFLKQNPISNPQSVYSHSDEGMMALRAYTRDGEIEMLRPGIEFAHRGTCVAYVPPFEIMDLAGAPMNGSNQGKVTIEAYYAHSEDAIAKAQEACELLSQPLLIYNAFGVALTLVTPDTYKTPAPRQDGE